MNLLCLIAQFYVALYPVGGPNLNANLFFQAYLAGPFLLGLYIMWKVYSWIYIPDHRKLYVPIKDIDIYSGMREGQMEEISGSQVAEDQRRQSIAGMQQERQKKTPMDWTKSIIHAVI
jgi:amino acid transporter